MYSICITNKNLNINKGIRLYGALLALVFTELIMLILYWIYDIAIPSRVIILDLPTNMDYFFLAGHWVASGLFVYLENCGNA
jgi:hypothetical protein